MHVHLEKSDVECICVQTGEGTGGICPSTYILVISQYPLIHQYPLIQTGKGVGGMCPSTYIPPPSLIFFSNQPIPTNPPVPP